MIRRVHRSYLALKGLYNLSIPFFNPFLNLFNPFCNYLFSISNFQSDSINPEIQLYRGRLWNRGFPDKWGSIVHFEKRYLQHPYWLLPGVVHPWRMYSWSLEQCDVSRHNGLVFFCRIWNDNWVKRTYKQTCLY